MLPGSERSQNSQSCANRPTAWTNKRAGPVLRAGLTDVFVTGIDDQMDQRQAKPDRDRGKTLAVPSVRRAEDDDQEKERHHDLGDEGRQHRITAGRMRRRNPFDANPPASENPALPLAIKYKMPAPAIAPRTWAMMYGRNSLAGNRFPAHRPNDTAGLRWPPEICPMAYAIVRTVNPNASETPAKPIPRAGKPQPKPHFRIRQAPATEFR